MSLALKFTADQLAALPGKHVFFTSVLAPSDVRAKVTENGSMQCLNCMKSWYASAVTANLTRRLGPATGRQFVRAPGSPPSLLDPSLRQKLGLPPSHPLELPPSRPQKVDLSGCRLVDVREEKQVERLLSEQRKKYQNHSGSTVTRELIVTGSFTFTVTIESSKLKSHNMDAGVTLFGFAAIQGHVQRQLSERYSVTLQSTASVSDKTSVAIKPYSTIEHIIQWKVVTWTGIALLGRSAMAVPGAIAQVPYQVPVRLTYDDDFIDVKDVPVKKKRS